MAGKSGSEDDRGGRPVDTGGQAYLGEAFTASAAWNTLRALAALSPAQPALAVPVWGLNHQLGALEIELHA